MTAIIKKVSLPGTLLPATKPYHHKDKLPAGPNDNRLDRKVMQAEQKKPRPKSRRSARSNMKKYHYWTAEERNDIVQRHDSGERWALIASDYNTTTEAIRGIYHRAIATSK